jgi:hypothetical protein
MQQGGLNSATASLLRQRRWLLAAILLLLGHGSLAGAGELALSGDDRWALIASRQDLVEAIAIASDFAEQHSRVVKSQNGWYAAIVGPYPASDMANLRTRYSGPDLPDDTILTRGKSFLETAWTPDYRWVLIASRQDLSEAVGIAKTYVGQNSRIVKSQNGWYAVVLGPVEARDIDSFRVNYNGPDLPPDSLLTRGTNFVSTAWTPDVGKAVADEPKAAGEGDPSASADNAAVTGEASALTDDAVDTNAVPRTLHFEWLGKREYAVAFPASFEFSRRNDDHILFRSGDISLLFFEEDLGDSKDVEAVDKDISDIDFIDDDFLDADAAYGFEQTSGSISGTQIRRQLVNDGAGKEKIAIAQISCCGKILIGILEFPSARKAAASAVADALGQSMLDVQIAGYEKHVVGSYESEAAEIQTEIDVNQPSLLPTANAKPETDDEKLYDACAYTWNKNEYAGRKDFRAMAGFFRDSEAWCRWRADAVSLDGAWEQIEKSCADEGIECRQFALQDKLSDWALEQALAVKERNRERFEQIQSQLNEKGAARGLHWTNEPSYNESELVYDVCSKLWNENNWPNLNNPKVMVAGSTRRSDGGYTGGCRSRYHTDPVFEQSDWDSMRAEVLADCRKDFASCYIFAVGNTLADWARQQETALADGSRFSSHASGFSGGNNGGSGVGGFLDFANGLLGAFNQGMATANAIRGAGGGGSGGYDSGNGAACAQFQALADECRRRQARMTCIAGTSCPAGSGNGGGQAGSFGECADLYSKVQSYCR